MAGTSYAQTPPDCHRREDAAVAARERAAAESPKALVPQIELAVCYDKAWQFRDVEPAIAKAIAILDAEIAAAPPAARAAGSRPIAGEDIPLPRRTRDAAPNYPAKALVAGITGSLVIELIIDPKGNVREARAVRTVLELEGEALKAARKWKFEPTLIAGQPTELVTYGSIRFGQTTEPIPSDWLAMAVFHYEHGRPKLARGTLVSAAARAQADRRRFGSYASGPNRGPDASITPPVKIRDVRPRYPARAQSLMTQGVVVIETLVDEQGRVGRAQIVGKPSVLDAAALEAILLWQFSPAMKDGSPVVFVMTATVNFSLR